MSAFTSKVPVSHFVDYFERLAGVVRMIGRSLVAALADVTIHCEVDDMQLIIDHMIVQWLFGQRDRVAGGALARS